MNALAAIAQPRLAWNQNAIMRQSARGLAQQLQAEWLEMDRVEQLRAAQSTVVNYPLRLVTEWKYEDEVREILKISPNEVYP